jgi:hypothetical protein
MAMALKSHAGQTMVLAPTGSTVTAVARHIGKAFETGGLDNESNRPQPILSPPSITSAWPVMKDERSETRNRIASAISSALAQRPIGILVRT